MDYIDPNYQGRVAKEVVKSITPEKLNTAIKEKRKELYKLRAKRYAKTAYKNVKKLAGKVNSSLDTKLKNKNVYREQNRVTIVENQPVYSKDKSRFFKTAWEEEKRQLFFH